MSQQKPIPNVTLTLSDGRQIFMSYGLLNILAQTVGIPDNIASVYLDMQLQASLIALTLGSFDQEKQVFMPAPLNANISLEDAENLTHWVVEHILDFFVRTMTKAQSLEAQFLPKLEPFRSTSTGSGSSALKNPSAGPSEPSPAN